MTIGIYCIKNSVDGKRYIGQSTNIWRRFNDHISSLNRGNHENVHLQRAWNLHGQDKFDFTILGVCGVDEIDELESYYISQYDTMNDKLGYNFEGGGNKNKIMSVETRRKISESRKGKSFMSDEAKIRMSERLKGNQIRKGSKMSEENKQKLIQVHKGNQYTKGKKFHFTSPRTEEHKRKLSISLKGRTSPNKGKSMSEEQKRKISETLKSKHKQPTIEDC